MKKLVLLVAVAAFAATVIGCGPSTPTKATGTGSTTVSKTEETKKN